MALKFPDRLREVWKDIKTSKWFNSKWFKGFFRLLYSIILLIIGLVLYPLIFDKTNLNFFERIVLVLSSGYLILSSSLVLLDKFFRIELYERKIRVEEKKLNSISDLDVDNISDQVASQVTSIVGSQLPLADTIYNERIKHYKKEKEIIANAFIDILRKRVLFLKNHLNKEKKIRIVLDSGTTIAPIFDKLGREAAFRPDHWSEGVLFATNSFYGVYQLLKYREYNPELSDPHNYQQYRHNNIPIKCSLFPGAVLAAYQAIADDDTVRAIKATARSREYYNICILTGNYIMYDSNKKIILPIARTLYHPKVKAAYYEMAHEVYLIAPLGKILTTKEPDQDLNWLLKKFNKELEYHSDYNDPESEAYTLVTEPLLNVKRTLSDHNLINEQTEDWMKKTTVITTIRPNSSDLLFTHSRYIKNSFSKYKFNTPIPLTKTQIEVIDFNGLPINSEEEKIIEFPHESHRPHIQKYFQGLD